MLLLLIKERDVNVTDIHVRCCTCTWSIWRTYEVARCMYLASEKYTYNMK